MVTQGAFHKQRDAGKSSSAFTMSISSPSHYTMSVENLSPGEVSAALRQIVSAPAFRQNNPGLSAAEISAIPNGVWPSSPVFTPYSFTHHGYSQSKHADVYLNPLWLTRIIQYDLTALNTLRIASPTNHIIIISFQHPPAMKLAIYYI